MLGSDCVKLLVSVAHPADVHLFKHLIWSLEKKGHDVKIIARNKEMCKILLDIYGFEYDLISNAANGLFGLGLEMVSRTKKCISIIKRYNPDLVLSMMDPSLAIASKVCRTKYISFADTEHAKLIISTALPFTDVVLTPSCFKKDFGDKQIRYDGYHELAYLHPNFFRPDPTVLSELELTENDPYIVLRFVSWGASHDVGQYGIKNRIALVQELEKFGKVFITSEGPLEKELERCRIRISPEKIHHLLYYATLYMGEGATMAVESAILGTPSIYVSTLAGTMGNFSELEEKYGLLFNYSNSEAALAKAIELLKDQKLKSSWSAKKAVLLRDKIDVTKFMIQFVEQYK